MSVFLTADSHFSDSRCMVGRHRPFETVDEMNETIITNWNALVAPDDVAYHLGDFATTEADVERFAPQLNGEIHLLIGNWEWQMDRELLRRNFAEVIEQPFTLDVPLPDGGSETLWLCHYPKQRNRQYYTATGHIHDMGKMFIDMVNVGVDVWHYRPIPIEWVIEQHAKQEAGAYDANVFVDAPLDWQWLVSTKKKRPDHEPTLHILRSEMAGDPNE